MVEVLCFSHQGVRCAIPSRQVLGAKLSENDSATVELWARLGCAAPAASRALCLKTAAGPCWIRASDVVVAALPPARALALTPVLRLLTSLSHVVGLTELGTELTWLVDAERFEPVGSGPGVNSGSPPHV
jgi:hypothetical protein